MIPESQKLQVYELLLLRLVTYQYQKDTENTKILLDKLDSYFSLHSNLCPLENDEREELIRKEFFGLYLKEEEIPQ